MAMSISRVLTRRAMFLGATAFSCLLPMLASAADPARVLVAGATGRTGGYIIRELRDAGYQVRAMTRDPARAAERLGDDWDWVQADVREPSDLTAAMQDVDFLVCSIGARSRSGPDGPEFVDYGGVRNLVDAAVEAGVRHFVLISSAAAGPHRKRSRMATTGDIRYWKTRGEDHLKLSGLDYTIIGPGGLMNVSGGATGTRVLARRDYGVGRIAMGEVARIAVHALTDPDARNKSFAAIEDDDIAPGAWRELLSTLPVDLDSDEAPPTAGDLP
jgi:uncharacterized protein YbjT (DUF2867 family)